MSAVIEAASRFMHLEEDSKAVAKLLRALADPDIDASEKDTLRFRAGLRLMRLSREVELIGEALDSDEDPIMP